MCVVKSPKVQNTAAKEKEPTIIRNPYLDGLDPATKALRTGRSSLRIERGGASTAPTTPVVQPSAPPASALSPVIQKALGANGKGVLGRF